MKKIILRPAYFSFRKNKLKTIGFNAIMLALAINKLSKIEKKSPEQMIDELGALAVGLDNGNPNFMPEMARGLYQAHLKNGDGLAICTIEMEVSDNFQG